MSEQHPTTSIEQRARDLFSGYVEEVAHIPTWETEEETTDVQALREAPHNGYGEPTLSDRQLIATATKLLDGSLLARPTLGSGMTGAAPQGGRSTRCRRPRWISG